MVEPQKGSHVPENPPSFSVGTALGDRPLSPPVQLWPARPWTQTPSSHYTSTPTAPSSNWVNTAPTGPGAPPPCPAVVTEAHHSTRAKTTTPPTMTTTDSLDTVILVLTCLEDITADLVIKTLHARGTTVVRLDPTDLGRGVSFDSVIGGGPHDWDGTLHTPSRKVRLTDIGAVYYRRPSPWSSEHPEPRTAEFAVTEARHGFGGLLHNLPCASYVNHPSAVARADRKPGQLQTAARVGFDVPPTLVTNDVEAARLRREAQERRVQAVPWSSADQGRH